MRLAVLARGTVRGPSGPPAPTSARSGRRSSIDQLHVESVRLAVTWMYPGRPCGVCRNPLVDCWTSSVHLQDAAFSREIRVYGRFARCNPHLRRTGEVFADRAPARHRGTTSRVERGDATRTVTGVSAPGHRLGVVSGLGRAARRGAQQDRDEVKGLGRVRAGCSRSC